MAFGVQDRRTGSRLWSSICNCVSSSYKAKWEQNEQTLSELSSLIFITRCTFKNTCFWTHWFCESWNSSHEPLQNKTEMTIVWKPSPLCFTVGCACRCVGAHGGDLMLQLLNGVTVYWVLFWVVNINGSVWSRLTYVVCLVIILPACTNCLYSFALHFNLFILFYVPSLLGFFWKEEHIAMWRDNGFVHLLSCLVLTQHRLMYRENNSSQSLCFSPHSSPHLLSFFKPTLYKLLAMNTVVLGGIKINFIILCEALKLCIMGGRCLRGHSCGNIEGLL